MSYIAGEERGQATLLPARLDDYVRDDAPVRVVDAFVNRLDMRELGFMRAVPAETGRPGYDPRDLLKLYIWGYLNEVRSSRRLERECLRNVEAMWLMRRLAPDFKTIADFRRDNGPALVSTCRSFVLFCRDEGLFAARLVALDGSKFRAAASPKRIMSREDMEEEAARLERRIAAYLADLDAQDAAEPEETSREATLAALVRLTQRREALDIMAAGLEAEGRSSLVEGEADARPMRMAQGGKPPCYNVATAVDADSGLILHHDVTTEATDSRLLHPIAKAAKEAIGVETLTVVADAGFSSGLAAALCEEDGITPCVPVKRSPNPEGETLFDRSLFTYQPETDTYCCPAGRTMKRVKVIKRDHAIIYASKDCSGCALKAGCTLASRRMVQRHMYEDARERMHARIEADPSLMRQRRCAVEHPFGTIKRMTAGGRFLTRGLKRVRAEAALTVLSYNLLRATNLLGAATLTARLA